MLLIFLELCIADLDIFQSDSNVINLTFQGILVDVSE